MASFLLQAIQEIIAGKDADLNFNEALATVRLYREMIEGEGNRAVIQTYMDKIISIIIQILEKITLFNQHGPVVTNHILAVTMKLTTIVPSERKTEIMQLLESSNQLINI